MSIDRRIWEWMPKRTTRARSTTQTVVAANLGLPAPEVAAAMERMVRSGHLMVDRRGNWHRGIEPRIENGDADNGANSHNKA